MGGTGGLHELNVRTRGRGQASFRFTLKYMTKLSYLDTLFPGVSSLPDDFSFLSFASTV